jgi:hypothetical protein
MRRTQRLRACVGSLLLLCSLTLLHAQNENRALPTNAESTRYVSQATIFAQQVETLNPNSVHDLYKIFFATKHMTSWSTGMGVRGEHSDRHQSEVSDLLQFVLDCLEDIRRCVRSMPLSEEQSLTIEAAIEKAYDDILTYAQEKGLL